MMMANNEDAYTSDASSSVGGGGEPGDEFYTYYDRFNDLIDYATWGAGELLAELLSCQDDHAQNITLHVADIDDDFSERNVISTVFDDMLALHLRVLFYLGRNEFQDAFATQLALLQFYNREILSKEKDANWFIPVLYTLCVDLRIIAGKADKSREIIDEDDKSFYEEAANPIMESFRICVAEGRSAMEITKKVAILSLTNQLFRIYYRENRLHLLKPLIRAIDQSGELYEHFSMPDKVTYKYFVGRKAIFDNDLKLANESLSFAFKMCPTKYLSNKRLILLYLVPVKMFLGYQPSHQLLARYDLRCFEELLLAVRVGDLARLIAAATAQEAFFIDSGIFLMVEKLKLTTFLNLIKLMHRFLQAPQIKLDMIVTALNRTGVEIDVDEVSCLLANLIYQKKMKGYISYNHQTLVLSKAEPFPAPA